MVADGTAVTAFAFAFALPLLTGGNTLFLLQPEEAFRAFVPIGLLAAATFLRSPQTNPRPLPPIASASLALFVVWWAVSVWWRTTGPRAGLEAQAIALAGVVHLALLRRPLSPTALRAFAVGLLIGTSATALYAQYQFWVIFPRIAPLLAREGRSLFTSVNANFYSGNCYAPFLAAVAITACGMFRRTLHPATRAAIAVAVVLLGATLLLTEARSVLALLVVIGSVVALSRREAELRRPFLLAAGAAFVLIGGVAIGVDLSELWNIGMSGRIAIWQGAAAMIADRWEIGVGPGMFAEAFPRYAVTSYYTRYPHNLMLEVLAEMGVIAGGALLVFLVTSTAAGSRALRADALADGGGALRAAFAGAALLLIAHAMVDIDWHAPANPIVLLTLLALAQAPGEGRA